MDEPVVFGFSHGGLTGQVFLTSVVVYMNEEKFVSYIEEVKDFRKGGSAEIEIPHLRFEQILYRRRVLRGVVRDDVPILTVLLVRQNPHISHNIKRVPDGLLRHILDAVQHVLRRPFDFLRSDYLTPDPVSRGCIIHD